MIRKYHLETSLKQTKTKIKMNNIIKLSTKADRNKPKNQKATDDVASKERGAPMTSRFGVSTKSSFTCFFRGAKGETGGIGHSENVESYVKKMKKRVEKNVSDVVNDPVEAHDVKNYMEADINRQILAL